MTSSSDSVRNSSEGPSKRRRRCSNASQPRSGPKSGDSPGWMAHFTLGPEYLGEPAESGYHRVPHSALRQQGRRRDVLSWVTPIGGNCMLKRVGLIATAASVAALAVVAS